MVPIISIVGTSGSGKTTLLEKLIPELKNRGYRIGTIKHVFHGLEFDQEGKDTWRHKAAGASGVIAASGNRIALFKDNGCDSLDSLALYLQDMDIIITEGYKRENRPKIEVVRAATGKQPIFAGDPTLLAFASDGAIDTEVPLFSLEDIARLADLIETKFLKDR